MGQRPMARRREDVASLFFVSHRIARRAFFREPALAILATYYLHTFLKYTFYFLAAHLIHPPHPHPHPPCLRCATASALRTLP